MRLLSAFAHICSDGSYKIIEKSELVKEVRGTKDFTALDQMVRYLSDNEMIDVKYSDDKVHCLTVLPKGRALVEGVRRKNRTATRIERKFMVILILGCFAASVIGAMIGSIIARMF